MFKKPQPSTRVRFEIALDSLTDKDIIDRINRVNNKSDYVRQLIREDIKKGSQ
jgi:hypothetical protein